MRFSDFNFDPGVNEGIDAIGFDTPTPIQEQAIPLIMEGHDVIASAQTGTGKTAAFLLPIIHKVISKKHDEHIKALVIVPTRELAVQIDQQMEGFSYFTPVSSIAVYGGTGGGSFATEKQALSVGADVIIGTPGRLIAHLNMGYVKLKDLDYLILDEADRMLDMGFYDDIMKIISFLPERRQNLMFSATMPAKIRTLAKQVLYKPKEINIAISKPAENILQLAYVVYATQKIPLVKHILQTKALRSVLVFCSTKLNTKNVAKALKNAGLAVAEIHSDLDQSRREEVIIKFKSRKIHILVATDILSRGIDIEDIDMVINYDVPNDGEDYIHRIGRTARAESDGVAITLISEEEQKDFLAIENLLETTVHKAKTPLSIGETPEYKPARKKSHHGKRPFKKRKGGHNQRRRGPR